MLRSTPVQPAFVVNTAPLTGATATAVPTPLAARTPVVSAVAATATPVRFRMGPPWIAIVGEVERNPVRERRREPFATNGPLKCAQRISGGFTTKTTAKCLQSLEQADRRGAFGNAQFAQDGRNVGPHGDRRDDQLCCHLVRRHPGPEHLEDLPLAWGQLGKGTTSTRVRLVAHPELFYQTHHQRTRKGGLTIDDALESARQPIRVGVLQQVAASAGRQRLE